jgi:hypothetical protein
MDDELIPNAILLGGPPAGPGPAELLHRTPDPDRVIKLLCGNRYEHFAPSAETEVRDGRPLRVFVWTHCTYVAE